MSLTLAVHSSKGGTGKTSIAMNLAGAYASQGKNVCLIDFDSKGPCFFSFFDIQTKYWINDVLHGRCSIMDAIHDISHDVGTKGKFYVGLSNPEISAIREISAKGKDWQAKALKTLMNTKKLLNSSGVDIFIVDTSPGVDFGSINAVAVSDYVVTVIKPSRICISSTGHIIDGVYKLLNKPCGIVENMCLKEHLLDPTHSEMFNKPVLASISCMCDVALKSDTQILTLTEPDHPFSSSMFTIAEKIYSQFE